MYTCIYIYIYMCVCVCVCVCVIARCDILFVENVLFLLLLEGQDGHTWKEHMCTLLQNVGVVH